MKQRFREDAAGTLRFSPPQGPPITSATIEIYGPGNDTVQASDTATLPAVNTALNMASGAAAGSKTLTLDATTSIAPLTDYWLGTVDTDTLELVNVRTIDSATAVTLNEGLVYDHDDNEEFRGGELSYSLTSTHTQTSDENYRAEWGYTVGSIAYTATQLFDVSTRVFVITVTAAQLRVHIPPSLRSQAPGVGSLSEFVAEAEEDIIRQLRRAGYKPDRVRDPAQFEYLAVLGTRRFLLERQADADPDFIDRLEDTRQQYENEWGRILSTGLSWYDADEDLTTDTDDDGTTEELFAEEGRPRALYGVLG